MMQLNRHRTGLVVGVFLGGWHVIWSALVWVGWGQPLIDFILWAHMIRVPYVVGPFDGAAAATLIAVTALAGYAIGIVLALIWKSCIVKALSGACTRWPASAELNPI